MINTFDYEFNDIKNYKIYQTILKCHYSGQQYKKKLLVPKNSTQKSS